MGLMQSKMPLRVLVLGLHGAGKTSLLYKLQMGKIVTVIPTMGFHVKKVECENVMFAAWDVGGQDMGRRLFAWRKYCKDTHQIVIFVVDSNDRDRIAEARDELHEILKQDELLNAGLLVFGNKADLPNSMSADEIIDKLGLLPLRRRYWRFFYCCATTGEGLYDGLDWLNKSLPFMS